MNIHLFSRTLASAVLFINNFIGLILTPYTTMRKIAGEKDVAQLVFMHIIAIVYFVMGASIRQKTLHPFIISQSSMISYVVFVFSFFLTVTFFYSISRILSKRPMIKPLIFTFTYALVPTVLWFYTTSLLYYLLPPPRTASFFGQSFSLLFIVFSMTLLMWKLQLFYLSLRFSLKLSFYQVLYYFVLYLLWFVPYSYSLYQLRIMRIPFI